MYHFIEKGMKETVSYILQIYRKANNKYMKSYNEDKSSKYIVYFDADNLCGEAMT